MTGNVLPVTLSKRRLSACHGRVKTKLPTYDQRLELVTGSITLNFEADQLLNRKRSYQDERVVELYLTAKGKALPRGGNINVTLTLV